MATKTDPKFNTAIKSGSKPTEDELKQEMRYFPQGGTIKPRTWFLDDLRKDFDKQRKKDFPVLASFALGMGLDAIKGVLGASVAAQNLLEAARELLKDAVRVKVAASIIDVSIHENKSGYKADQELFVSLGTNVVTAMVTVVTTGTIPLTLPASFLFAVTIWTMEWKKEEQEEQDNALARGIDLRLEEIRHKTQEKLDKKHELEVERILVTNWAHDAQDKQAVGSVTVANTVVPIAIGACAQLADVIRGSLQVRSTQSDLVDVFVSLKIDPREVETQAPQRKADVDAFLNDKFRKQDEAVFKESKTPNLPPICNVSGSGLAPLAELPKQFVTNASTIGQAAGKR